MQDFEIEYAELIDEILSSGDIKQTRNGATKSLFGKSLLVDNLDTVFPLIQCRKMYPKGVFGEFAAMVRGPKCVADFEFWGCNYWSKWAKDDGSLKVDYGNAWLDFNGANQIEDLREALKTNPNDRRMIITGWRPDRLYHLDLPCCHYSYQFHVANGKLNMIWTQRSVDMMIGLPSDIILAAIWVIALANDVGLTPGYVKMDLGDCHVYEEHYQQATEYCIRVFFKENHPTISMQPLQYEYLAAPGEHMCNFEPSDIMLSVYDHLEPMELELKA